MFQTAEVRWFYPEPLPAHVIAWFCGKQSLEPQERTDRYLIFPGCETVGVKVREGRFEIKALQGTGGIVRYAPHVTGRAECWVKWSYGDPPVEPWVRALQFERADWIDVVKARRLRSFVFDGTQVAEVPGLAQVELGATVELTRITALDRDWWALAFEAFGASQRNRETLHAVAGIFFAHNPPPVRLNVTQSCSYPTWLAGL